MKKFVKISLSWLSRYAILMGCSVLFILSLGFTVHMMIEYNYTGSFEDQYDRFMTEALTHSIFIMGISGTMILILVFGNSLTLARKNKEIAKANRDLHRQVDAIEVCGDGIAMLDENGCYTFMNKAHAQYYGYEDPKELIGRSWRTLYSSSRTTWFEREVFPFLEEFGEWRGRSTGRKKDGSEYPQELRLNLLDSGGMVCIVRDITEKMRNEGLLKMIKVAVEAAEDGIAITDSNNKLIFMNRSFLKIHGYDPYERDKYLNTDWRDLYNEKGREQINATVLPTTILKGAWSGSIPVMKKNGVIFQGDASLTKLPDGTILGVMRDVTERRVAEAEKNELREQLFQAQKMEAIGRLTQGMTYDFNNILAVIQGYTQFVKNEAEPPSLAPIYASKIYEECLKARELVDQLMAFTRKKDQKVGVFELARSVVDLEPSLLNIMGDNVTPVIDLHVNEAFINAHPGPILQTIKSMVMNGVEAIGDKPGKVALSLKEADQHLLGLRRQIGTDIMPERAMASVCRFKETKGRSYLMTGYVQNNMDYYHLTISDTGKGIDKDILPHIFEPFFTTKPDEKRAGLGLFAALGIIIGYNGAIVVETVVDEGTSFHLFLPKATFGSKWDNDNIVIGGANVIRA